MKRSLLILFLLLFSGLMLAWSLPARAQNPAVLYLDPAEVTLAPGESAGFTVLIEGASDLFGLEIHLAYDPAVVRLLDAEAATPGVQLIPGDFLDPENGFLVTNAADNTRGELNYALTLLAPAGPVSGDGLILAFELQAIAAGTTPLDLSAILASTDGAALPVTVESGRITVTAGQTTGGASPAPTLAVITPQRLSTPLPSTATAAAEGGGAGGRATRAVATRVATAATTTTPDNLAEAEAPAGTAAPPQSDATETGPSARDDALAATTPQEQSGSLAPPADPSGEGTQTAANDAGPATPAPIGGQTTAPSETNSQAGEAGSPPVGWLILGSFLLFAAILFFGRRLLRRIQ